MLLLKADVARIWILALVVPLLVQTRLRGQDISAEDSTRFVHSRMTHHLEAGINTVGAGLEYHYQWIPFLSTDVVLSLASPGIGFGLTFSPVWIFFVQGVIGRGSHEEPPALDGPPGFKADYLYGWRAGFRLPINPRSTRLYFIIGVGQVKNVQNHYQYTGGGFIVGPPPTPLFRTETRMAEVYSIGFGLSF